MKAKIIYTLLLFCLVVAGTSCRSRETYTSIQTGSFKGSVNLQWISPEKFIFIPDPKRPFYFIRASGEIIQPQAMFTDLGSSPRLMTMSSGFSSNGYVPAYIIHDWLYINHSKAVNEGNPYDIERSALILAEGIKTLMEANNSIRPKPRTLNLIYKAAKSPFARYAAHIKPWHSALSPPENIAKMDSLFYQSSTPEIPSDSTEIRREKINKKAFYETFFPSLPHFTSNP